MGFRSLKLLLTREPLKSVQPSFPPHPAHVAVKEKSLTSGYALNDVDGNHRNGNDDLHPSTHPTPPPSCWMGVIVAMWGSAEAARGEAILLPRIGSFPSVFK